MEETITILKGIQKYEDYHHVQYTDAAIESEKLTALSIATSKVASRPDLKAIDAEAGSKMNLTRILWRNPKNHC